MKDILEELADDHNKSLEKLKDVPEREATNNEAWEFPDRTPVKGGLNRKKAKTERELRMMGIIMGIMVDL